MQQQLEQLLEYLNYNLGGGEPILPLRYVINVFKGLTPIVMVLMMWYYQNFSLGAYIYFVLHGSYGLLWLVKDLTFGDKTWARKATIPSSALVGFTLFMYWVMGWIQMSGNGTNNPSNARLVTALFSYIFGVNMMLVSDAQKYYTLKFRSGLISDGMFYATRNPNYLGEMLVYGSYAIITAHMYSYILLLTIWSLVFYTNMIVKDRSLKKKEGWEQYSRRSWILLPKLYSSDQLSYAFYGIFALILIYDYSVGGLIQMLKN